jgi:hypothetical protein
MGWREEDDAILRASADELNDYLSSPSINWVVTSSRLTLTLGRVLLALKRIESESDLQSLFADTVDRVKSIKNLKRSAWDRKALLEFPFRLRQWKNIIGEYVEEGQIDHGYSTQVYNRVILELLNSEIPFPDLKNTRNLEVIDQSLRKMITGKEYVWDSSLKPLFPSEIYWYLYM